MDAASGRPLGWLPAGLTSLILSLERTEVQFKAFSVSHAVKALLSVKRNDSGTHKDHLWGIPFERSAAHRELAKPLEAAGLYSTPSNSCSCDESSEYCTCGCADWSEEAFEDHELPLLLNGPCLQGRRDSRFGGFSWASPLERRAVEGKYFGGSGRIAEENVEEGSAHDAEEVDGLSSKQTHQDDVKTDAGDVMASSSSCGSSGSGGLPKWNFRMGQNAGAGALAGGVVSLCLHPIDTLKTIVQAQTGGTRHLLPILSSIISERGLKGLYRGLGSNLTSSAPISAIYTLTYEAVKAGLLRHIPEDMSAFAHCAAGGCASVATSFVYTPSECVKQQMQVNGLYQNSWQAFTSILKQGGLPMLYKGWGAVLCRNVPQSVIKFYTYEGLKLWAQGGQPRDTPLTTLQALAIGGVAGSTAAFFTTPLDVVKTRLQTQIPGSVQQYNGVIHAFQSIATTEGVAGLYRGLVPRLVIYVTQGALFFASYEFIKHVLAVEVPRLRIKTSQIEGYQRQPAPIPAEST